MTTPPGTELQAIVAEARSAGPRGRRPRAPEDGGRVATRRTIPGSSCFAPREWSRCRTGRQARGSARHGRRIAWWDASAGRHPSPVGYAPTWGRGAPQPPSGRPGSARRFGGGTPKRSLRDQVAPVHHELRARDVRGLVAGEEERGVDDIARGSEPPQRHPQTRPALIQASSEVRTSCSGVSTNPGWMQFARTPCPANWIASDLVRETTAPLLVV